MPGIDPVTLGEVDRNVQRLREELNAGLTAVSARMDRALDRTVPSDLYTGDKTTFEYRINDIEKDIKELKEDAAKELEKQQSNRRLIIGAFVAPALLFLMNTVINLTLLLNGHSH